MEENVFIFRAYNLSDINVVWKSVDDEFYVYGGDELYATIDVERKGLLVKLSFYWNQEKLNQNISYKYRYGIPSNRTPNCCSVIVDEPEAIAV